MEITWKTLADYILKGIVFILAVSILFGIGGFVYTKYFMDPTYSANVKFYASGEESNTQSLNYSQSVAPQYIEFLNVVEFFEMVAQDLHQETGAVLSPAVIRDSVQFSTIVQETTTFYVTVTVSDPNLAYNIARSIAVTAPARVKQFENVGALEVISNPVVPAAPTGPSLLRNTALFFLIGFLLSAAIVVLREMMDNRLRNAEEIPELFGIPVFGVVPDFSEKEQKGGR